MDKIKKYLTFRNVAIALGVALFIVLLLKAGGY